MFGNIVLVVILALVVWVAVDIRRFVKQRKEQSDRYYTVSIPFSEISNESNAFIKIEADPNFRTPGEGNQVPRRVPRHKRNRVTVLAFMPDGTRSTYRFSLDPKTAPNGEPDYERIQRETIGDGANAALVFRYGADKFAFITRDGRQFTDAGEYFPMKEAGEIISVIRTVYTPAKAA